MNNVYTESDLELFKQIRKIADLIIKYAIPPKIWLEDRRNESVNPFQKQSKDGIYLELYYGKPSYLITPWGRWGFGGSGSGIWDDYLPIILKRLGAELTFPIQINKMGEYGPVYALHCIDDVKLPEPSLKKSDESISYELAKDVWEQMSKHI